MSDEAQGQQQGGTGDAGGIFTGTGTQGEQGQQQQQQQQAGGSFRDQVLAEDGSFVGRWTDRLPEDLKQHEATLGRFPNMVELARSYVHARSKLGEKIAPPADNSTPDQVKAWREMLGVPEQPEGYALKKPEKLPDGVEWNEGIVKGFAGIAHKHHVPPAAVNEIVNWWTQQQGELAKEAREAASAGLAQALQKQESELRQEWGTGMDEKFSLAMRVARTAGLEGNPADWTPKDIVKALELLGRGLSEDRLIKADGPGAGISARQAAMEIMDPKNQDRIARAYRGELGMEEQKGAQAHLEKLLKAADQGKNF